MKSIWRALLMLSAIVAMTTGSPVEFKDQEKIAPFAVRDPTYRLPKVVRPIKYDLEIKPYFETEGTNAEFTFDGIARISLTATAAVQKIVLHRHELDVSHIALSGAAGISVFNSTDYDETKDLWTINLTGDLPIGTESILTVHYKGYMRDDMHGFYKTYYMQNNTRVYMASTQFQQTEARRAFPCFDEPGFKASFILKMRRPKDMTTISNTRLASTADDGPGRDMDTFLETPKMSTYLLAFIVSKYEGLTNGNATFPHTFGVFARPLAKNFTALGFEFGEKMIKQFGVYLGIDYYSVPNIHKLDQAAIPDFSAGAMENWGLLTYRETNILHYPDDTPSLNEQRIVAVVAHEEAHQWFGDLVTCTWWSETWLNEGFARYFQYFGTKMIPGYESWELEEQFVVENLQQSMQLDATDDSHPMTDDTVSTKSQASGIFDNISYNKAASIIRMLEHYLGVTSGKFQDTLKRYLQDNRDTAVVPDNLFTAINNVNPSTQGSPSVTEEFWAAWTATVGFPLVTVERKEKTLTLKQKRFMRLEEGNNKTEQFNIPINVAIDSDDYSKTTPDFLFKLGSTNATMTWNLTKTPEKYYILNKQQTGFYRVNYDTENWNKIKEALMTDDHDKIHVLNRAQIVDDLFNLARAGIVDYPTAVDIIRYIKKEKSYIPWLTAINHGLTFLSQRVSGEKPHEVFAWFILDLTKEIYDHLKFEEVGGAKRTDIYNRANIISWACKYGHEDCIEKSTDLFENFRINGTKVPKDHRNTVYCNAVRHGKVEQFDFLYNRFLTEDISAEQLNLLAGMACTKDKALVKKYLDRLINTDDIRPQDRAAVINNVLNSNPEGPQMIYDYITENADSINRWKTKMGSLSTLSSVAGRFTSAEQFTAYETFLKAQEAGLGAEAYGALNTAMINAKKNLDWDNKYMKAFNEHLEKLKNSAPVKVISIMISMISIAVLYIFN